MPVLKKSGATKPAKSSVNPGKNKPPSQNGL